MRQKLGNSDDDADGDNDGVANGCDICPSGEDNADADNDTVPDACDICPSGDDNADADNDTVPDACDVCPNGEECGVECQAYEHEVNLEDSPLGG